MFFFLFQFKVNFLIIIIIFFLKKYFKIKSISSKKMQSEFPCDNFMVNVFATDANICKICGHHK